jgi:hypothetical protein
MKASAFLSIKLNKSAGAGILVVRGCGREELEIRLLARL